MLLRPKCWINKYILGALIDKVFKSIVVISSQVLGCQEIVTFALEQESLSA